MRLESEFEADTVLLDVLDKEFKTELAARYGMSYQIYSGDERPRMAIFVSKYNHCLYDLLSRYHSGELNVEIPFILSNHKDLEHIAHQFDNP